jgi:hypothetical protein
MTRSDLIHGDRPWRAHVKCSPRPWWAIAASAVVAAAVVAAVPALGLLAVAAWCWWAARPELALVGGRAPLGSGEWLDWNAHFDLSAQEAEERQKKSGN